MARPPAADRGPHVTADEHARSVFGEIYTSDAWEGGSGEGSRAPATETYRRVVERLVRGSDVRTVVDAGCGDWEFSQLVDWGSASYLGLDVVPEVIERDQEAYARPGISFRCSDFHLERPPPADLLLCKDVLQHWPVAWIQDFLGSVRRRYRYCLLTNDVASTRPSHPQNADIELGDWRPLDLEVEPFGVRAAWRLDYDVGGEWTKRVLLTVSPAHRLVAGLSRRSGLRALRDLGS